MTLTHVITRLIVGGAQENTLLTCRGLVEKGHAVTLIAGPQTGPEGSLWDRAARAGCEVIKLDALRREVRPFSDRRAISDLRRLFERIRPDVVHTHSSKAGILGRLAARRAAVPIVIHTIHGMSFNRTQSPLTRAFYRRLERRAARTTTHFVTVSDAMIDQAVAAGIAPRSLFTTIHSGMETDRFKPDEAVRTTYRKAWGAAGTDIVVGTLARLFKNKGYEQIIEAMPQALSRVANLRFVWIGDGAQRNSYERRLVAAGLRDRVHFAGLVDPDEVPALLSGCDMILHASKWEGLPRALVQGMLCGLPGVSFDNDGAPEVVHHGETGLLVPFGDIGKLADAVVALAGDARLRRRLGQTARRRCLDRFDWRTMFDRLEKLYADLRAARTANTTNNR